MRKGLGDHLFGVVIVGEVAREILVVRGHIEVPMPGQVEANHLGFAGLLALQRFIDGDPYGVRG